MAKKVSSNRVSNKKLGRGRPQLYPLTARETKRVETLINGGWTANEIKDRTGFHEFAILRVRRAM